MQLPEEKIAFIVQQVMEQMKKNQPTEPQKMASRSSSFGVFSEIEEAVNAANRAQKELVEITLKKRGELISLIREVSVSHADEWASLAEKTTGMGRAADKALKNVNAAVLTPGIEEIQTMADAGDSGLVLVQRAPYGVIASIEPVTHPTACLINHAIAMISGGNTVFFLPHPRGLDCALAIVRVLNKAIIEQGGPANLLVVLDQATLETVSLVSKHPGIDLVVVTGGSAVVEIAFSSGKKVIAAGAGNPPVVVDETAILPKAAEDIIKGATFDNNSLCIAEKVIIAVDSIAGNLITELEKKGAYNLASRDINRLTGLVVKENHINVKYICQDAKTILKDLGVQASNEVRTVLIEVPSDHVLVRLEQMMPVLPLVRVPCFETALKLAVEVEQGFGHTAIIHSESMKRITAYARAMNTTIVVANAPCVAGLGVDGEGVYSHTIASSTGEGVTTVSTFTRERRLMVGKSLQVV